MEKMLPLGISAMLMAVVAEAACSFDNSDQDNYILVILNFTIAGIVIGLLMVIVLSLPLCCGILKQYGVWIAGVGNLIGLVACIFPLMGSMIASAKLVDSTCDRCGSCSDEERETIKKQVKTIVYIGPYLFAHGWVAVVLGIVSAGLGFCICCKCCRMKDDGSQNEKDSVTEAI